MINEDLLSYTRGQLKAGATRDDIKKALATGGWSEQDAKEAFDAIDGVMVPPAAPVPMAPKALAVQVAKTQTQMPAPATLRPATPIGIGEAARMAQGGTTRPAAPMQQTPALVRSTPQPVMPRLEIDTRPVVAPNMTRGAAIPAPHTKRKFPWLFISVLAILLALGGAGYWFYPQVMTNVDTVKNIFFPTTIENTLPTDFPIEDVVPTGTSATPAASASTTENVPVSGEQL